MIWILCYDIEQDPLRQKLAKLLEKSGWERLQKSVFVISLDQKEYDRFMQGIQNRLGKQFSATDKIFAWSLSDARFAAGMYMGPPPDVKMILGQYASFYAGEEFLLK